jgi:hypothetical protein
MTKDQWTHTFLGVALLLGVLLLVARIGGWL